MAIITMNSFNDDCLRLKICSLNQKDLRSIPVEFILVDSVSERTYTEKNWILIILQKSWRWPILARANHAKDVIIQKS